MDDWLAGKLITLLNDSDVNKISHSFEKCHEAEERGGKIPYMHKFEPAEKLYSAVRMNDSHTQSKNISVTMPQLLE